MTKQQEKQTELYNHKVGDRVLLANKGEQGPRKLADHWEG